MNNKQLDLSMIDVFIFDFDGVLTDNKVLVDENGKELVVCNRSDGLAFDALRKLKKPVYILSTEVNNVVYARAKKLQVKVIHAVQNKEEALDQIIEKNAYKFEKTLYVGNDINDFNAMQKCGIRVCPFDSHEAIKEIADLVLSKNGGQGVIRELVERVFDLDLLNVLFYKET